MLRQIEWQVQNGPITKNGVFASNYLIFSKILFQFKSLLQRVDLMHQRPNCPHSYFFVSAGVLFDGAFSLRLSITQ